ncbi:MAG: glycosyltransferase family 2 protein [Oscillospiraceae bacterium]|nr:glycosyltransferase family 2 protein [Oscillospiraceae bacterium]
MKARVSQNQNQTTSYNYDKNIVLSVSMIVKNEEKMLKTCLDCLKPLLDNVKSELIIVDTGSTDQTVEIARQYTDKIFHFDWINDFGAARNFGLEKCTGQWFMFLDADDHFVDVGEMVEFFNNENISRNYNTAYYITHNFTSVPYDKYFRFFAHRIARKTDNLRFEGAIHEYFIHYYNPGYYFNSYANHYGYAFETQEKLEAKSERNLTLLEKELQKNPDDLRNIHHYVASMLKIDDRKRELIEKGMKLADNSEAPVLYTAYFNAYEMHAKENQHQKAINALDRAIKKANPDNAILADAYAYKALQLFELCEYEKSEENIKKYFEVYRKKEMNALDNSALGFVISNFLIPEGYAEMKNKLVNCLVKQEKHCESFKVYSDFDFDLSPEIYKSIINNVIEIAKDKSAREGLAEFYERIVELGDREKIAYFERRLEELYYYDESLAASFKSGKSGFAKLMQLCQTNDILALGAFLNKRVEPLPESYSEAIFLALKSNLDLSPAIAKMDCELMLTHLLTIAKERESLPSLALRYKNDEFFFSSIKNLLFGVLLFEASLNGAKTLNNAEKSMIYGNYSKYSALYIANAYNPNLLNDSDIGVLPETHRFGYYMGVAQKALDGGDKTQYVRTLKKALDSCSSMKDVVRFILEEFSSTL